MPEAAMTPADIEARIAQRRQELATTLDEIAVRVHPKTLADQARSRALAAADRTAGQAYVAVNRRISDVRAALTTPDGAPRMERVVPLALAVGAAGVVLVSARRRRRRSR